MALRLHFVHQHVRDTMVILEKGNLPHPRCPRYNMLVPWAALNGRHTTTVQCEKGVERKHRQLVVEDMQVIMERAFQAYGWPLNLVTSFKYLG